jgi:hypothetical protein
MAFAMCEKWDESFCTYLPGYVHTHGAFRASHAAEEVAVILDLAGAYFTPHARQFLRRRPANDGVGWINYITWDHEWIHHMNQLAAFSPGRLGAYAVLEQKLPRVEP